MYRSTPKSWLASVASVASTKGKGNPAKRITRQTYYTKRITLQTYYYNKGIPLNVLCYKGITSKVLHNKRIITIKVLH